MKSKLNAIIEHHGLDRDELASRAGISRAALDHLCIGDAFAQDALVRLSRRVYETLRHRYDGVIGDPDNGAVTAIRPGDLIAPLPDAAVPGFRDALRTQGLRRFSFEVDHVQAVADLPASWTEAQAREHIVAERARLMDERKAQEARKRAIAAEAAAKEAQASADEAAAKAASAAQARQAAEAAERNTSG